MRRCRRPVPGVSEPTRTHGDWRHRSNATIRRSTSNAALGRAADPAPDHQKIASPAMRSAAWTTACPLLVNRMGMDRLWRDQRVSTASSALPEKRAVAISSNSHPAAFDALMPSPDRRRPAPAPRSCPRNKRRKRPPHPGPLQPAPARSLAATGQLSRPSPAGSMTASGQFLRGPWHPLK